MVTDYLNNPINIGDRAIRVHSYGHYKEFVRGEIVKIKHFNGFNQCIGFLTDGNTKMGWTYPHRIITEKGFTKDI